MGFSRASGASFNNSWIARIGVATQLISEGMFIMRQTEFGDGIRSSTLNLKEVSKVVSPALKVGGPSKRRWSNGERQGPQ
jgi:hypothetical protein